MTTLQVIWFLVIGFLIAGYAVLDGFDLGVGFWHLFAGNDSDRRKLLAAIGPVWDANEVWLLAGGGAIFAAFPHVYATVFSGLYLALMLILVALIFRAVAAEFRNKERSARWQQTWDIVFAVGSVIPALLFGVAVGNILRGLPLDESKNYVGTFFGLLNPYSLVTGLLGFAMFATHGALYIVLKTEGELHVRAKRWAQSAAVAYGALFLLASAVTIGVHGQLIQNYRNAPWLWALPAIALIAIVLIVLFNRTGEAAQAFVASSLSIVSLLGIVGTTIFPNLVPARGRPELSLTIANACSSPLTLKTMLIIALIGMPVVLAYTVWMQRRFSGKVREDDLY